MKLLQTNTDSYFTMGKAHDICQDYAISGDNFAILSDGCSSSPRTDLGARFLTLGAEQWLKEDHNSCSELENIPENTILFAQMLARMALLPAECLDATLGYIYMYNDSIDVLFSGDGVIAARKRSGDIEIHTIDYPSGAPAYLNYIFNDKRRQIFLEQDQGHNIKRYLLDKELQSHGNGFTYHTLSLDVSEYDLVAIFSDGVTSFQRPVVNELETSRYFENINIKEIINPLMNIKSFKGKFITRRCKRFLKESAKKGWHHNDDFSMAAMYIG